MTRLTRRFYLALALKMEGKQEEAEKELRGLHCARAGAGQARGLSLGELLSNRGMFEEAARPSGEGDRGFPARLSATDRGASA